MAEVFIPTPPHSAEAEQAVIGSMLINPRRVPDVLAQLAASDFYGETNRQIFQTIAALHDSGQPIDAVLVRNRLASGDGDTDAARYLDELVEATPTASHALQYARIVQDKALLRAAAENALEAARAASEGAGLDEVQGFLQKALAGAEACPATEEVIGLPDATVRLYETLDARHRTGGGIAGLSTGFKDLDVKLGGLRPGNMLVVAARSGMGKSALVLNIATETARLSNRPVLVFSLEMSAVELAERVYANRADVELNRLRDGSLSDDDWNRLSAAQGVISEIPLRIVESPSLDVAQIARICRAQRPALVVIDHIGLVRPSGKSRDRREAMDAISRAVKVLAKDLDVPVVAVAQLNRAIMARANKEPLLSDLRESGAIEQDADVVAFIHRPAYYSPNEDRATASLIVAKNRHGQTGKVPLLWNGSRQRFVDDWTEGLEEKT
jgi:replicative DNA helicase